MVITVITGAGTEAGEAGAVASAVLVIIMEVPAITLCQAQTFV
jgi:hypothetical protein